MKTERARQILDQCRRLRILVAGDLMLDEFVWGSVSRISPEAPVPVVEVTGESFYAGGAANVARNLRDLGAQVSITGLRGMDAAGERLAGLLAGAGIDASAVAACLDRDTIIKTRVIARHQQVVRIDREQRLGLAPEAADRLLAQLAARSREWDAVVFSDYAKGFLTPAFVSGLCQAARGKVITVDPSPLNTVEWRGVTAIKPNLKEARAAAGLLGEAPPEEAGRRLLDRWKASMVLITMGEHGMLLLQPGRAPYHTPTRAREIFDVSGAGDTAIAVFTLCLAAGATAEEAAELANHASGVAVGKLGTATVLPEELVDSIERMQ